MTHKVRPRPLSLDEIVKFRTEHLPYRLHLIKDAVSRVPAKTVADCQAFEAAAVSGRLLLDFLGVGFDPKDQILREARTYHSADDVKVIDIGGRYVEIDKLTKADFEILARFIHGVHKACAHLTLGSNHGLDVPTFQQATPIILRLYEENKN